MLLFISGPSRFDGERRFGGDRDGYRGGPRGPTGDFGDKGGAPADYRPSFGVNNFNHSYDHLSLYIHIRNRLVYQLYMIEEMLTRDCLILQLL